MPFGKADRRHGIGLYFWFFFDQEATLRGGDFFPKHGFSRSELHFAAQFSRDGNLASFSDRCFHMMNISCEMPAATDAVLISPDLAETRSLPLESGAMSG